MEQTANSSSHFSNIQPNFTSEEMTVIMHDASCTWSSNEQEERNLVLDRVSLSLPKGSLIAIIGEVKSLTESFQYSIYSLLFGLFYT